MSLCISSVTSANILIVKMAFLGDKSCTKQHSSWPFSGEILFLALVVIVRKRIFVMWLMRLMVLWTLQSIAPGFFIVQ